MNTEGSDQLANTLVVNRGFRLAWFGYGEPDTSNSIRIVAHAGDQDGFLNGTSCSETPATLAIQAGELCCIKAIAGRSLGRSNPRGGAEAGFTSVASIPEQLPQSGRITRHEDEDSKAYPSDCRKTPQVI